MERLEYMSNRESWWYWGVYVFFFTGCIYSLMPGVFIKIPSKGTPRTVALVHTVAIILAINYIIDPLFLFLEGFIFSGNSEGFTRIAMPPPRPPPKPIVRTPIKGSGVECTGDLQCSSKKCKYNTTRGRSYCT